MNLRSLSGGVGILVLLLAGCAVAPASPASPVTAPATPPASAAPASATPSRPAATPSATPSARVRNAPEVRVASVSNFRDVAGTGAGLTLADGGHMKRGVVFRSGRLHDLTSADERVLVAAGVTDVFDLRTDAVARRSPDASVGKATYHLINVFAVPSRVDPFPVSVAAARLERQEMNRDFVADPKQRKRIALLLRGIADARGAVIIHCTEGKDRTGWSAAILQLLAGADRATVMKEYLLSNERRADIIERGVAQARRAKGRVAGEITRARLEVAESYLRAGLNELERRYGDLDGYLTDGLGLSRQTVERLRAKLLAS